MARIRWHGGVYATEPVKQLLNGDWLMRSREHGPRFTVGTMLQVKQADIISLDDDAAADPAARAAEIEAAMAEERKTLKPVAELLEQGKQNRSPGDAL